MDDLIVTVASVPGSRWILKGLEEVRPGLTNMGPAKDYLAHFNVRGPNLYFGGLLSGSAGFHTSGLDYSQATSPFMVKTSS